MVHSKNKITNETKKHANTLVENDLVVVAGVAVCTVSGDKVLVTQHKVGPGQAEEAEHAAHGALGVEHKTLAENWQTTSAYA